MATDTSVGAVDSSFDNALAETIIRLYRTELIHRGKPWKTVEDVEMATARWVAWFNNDRIYQHCGDVPPVELESAHYAQCRAVTTG